MNETEFKVALDLARHAIREFLETGTELRAPDEEPFSEPRGVFVSLKMDGDLRGCIGFPDAQFPLGKAIVKCAINSATEDPRFLPLTLSELDHVRIEISLLSPYRRIQDPSEVEIGTHGIIISSGMRRGLLLPQVPVENHWNRETFLRYGCLKAGLPDEAWKFPDTAIYVFSAEVFKEELIGSAQRPASEDIQN